jgi:Flp pilus assembly protein TadB
MAEARKLPMDVADETGASATQLTAALAPRRRDASVASGERAEVQLPEGAWKDSHAVRQGGRWSPRATLAVSGGVALLLWGLVGLAVSAIR